MAKDFKIAKPVMSCAACQKDISEGEDIVAIVRIADDELIREDLHPACWAEPLDGKGSQDREILGVWRTTLPVTEQKKKKLLVDDALLINFFERLEGHEDTLKSSFRFVLALILMRKKLLTYEGLEKTDGRDYWKIKLKGQEEISLVIDPGMDEDKIASVSESLNQIMEGDFET